ncbi:MAG TPA: hypothetical protein VKA49_01815 [Flavitalea sp.]|nr:hypothetical protein [Flavitalea sp.]
MFGAIVLIVLLYFISVPILEKFRAKLPWLPVKLLQTLYWYHILFAIIYYLFTRDVRSDSKTYYYMSTQYTNWLDSYQSGTVFLHFVSYPFTKYLMFSYEMMMVLFSWMGYWGFVYFYIVFRENLRFKHKLFGFELITLFVFLPNMHYWTASLGKGSIIFLGIALAIYALSRISSRKIALILGLVIVYHVRPHVFLFMAIGILVGVFTGKEKVPLYQKALVFTGSAVALFLLYDTIISFVGLDEDNLFDSFTEFSDVRAYELSKSAGSGIDTSNYPLGLKLLTFWFRPLFFDAPSLIGIVVSFENLLYLFLTLKLIDRKFFGFIKSASSLVKTSAVTFLATSFALSGTLSNLGIIIRQKSMVMYFLLFLILSFMDYKQNIRLSKKRVPKRNIARQFQRG